MTRLFSKSTINPNQGLFTLDEADSKYLIDVLRMRIGDTVILCDARRIEFISVISNISNKKVSLTFSGNHKNESEPPYIAHLFQGLAKGERMDFAIQKSVEMGVAGIVPVACIRSIVKISNSDVLAKTSRWQKISEEAARQSGRGYIPEVFAPMTFEDAIRNASGHYDLVLIPWEEETAVSLPKILEEFVKRSGISKEESQVEKSGGFEASPKIAIFIGPEGGFDKKEIDFAVSHGAAPVSLGKRILRTETAGIAVLSMLLYRLELL